MIDVLHQVKARLSIYARQIIMTVSYHSFMSIYPLSNDPQIMFPWYYMYSDISSATLYCDSRIERDNVYFFELLKVTFHKE